MKKKYISAIAGSILVLGLMTACGENQGSTATTTATPDVSTEVGTSAEVETPTEMQTETPTETPETAEVTAEPTEEATPTEEAVVEDNPNIIEGVDFTQFNEEGIVIDFAVHEMTFDEPRVIVTSGRGSASKAVTFLSNEGHFTQEEGKYTYYVYAPKPVKAVNFNEERIEINVDGVTLNENHIETMEGKVWDNNGEQYTHPYSFYYNDYALVADDCVYIVLEYEDGDMDTLAVYITKDYVIE